MCDAIIERIIHNSVHIEKMTSMNAFLLQLYLQFSEAISSYPIEYKYNILKIIFILSQQSYKYIVLCTYKPFVLVVRLGPV